MFLFRISRLSQRLSWRRSGAPIIEPALPVLTEVVSAAPPGVQDQSLALECMITEHGIGESNTGALVALTLIKQKTLYYLSNNKINGLNCLSFSIFPLLTVPCLQGSCTLLLQDSVRAGSMISMLRKQ